MLYEKINVRNIKKCPEAALCKRRLWVKRQLILPIACLSIPYKHKLFIASSCNRNSAFWMQFFLHSEQYIKYLVYFRDNLLFCMYFCVLFYLPIYVFIYFLAIYLYIYIYIYLSTRGRFLVRRVAAAWNSWSATPLATPPSLCWSPP